MSRFRYVKYLIALLSSAWLVDGQPGKCDQTPPQATVLDPSEDKGIYHLQIQNAAKKGDSHVYTPDQTYVCKILYI